MPYTRTCPSCGATLDPGERCDCGGAVFRLRVGDSVKLIDQETFMDILQKIKPEKYSGSNKN